MRRVSFSEPSAAGPAPCGASAAAEEPFEPSVSRSPPTGFCCGKLSSFAKSASFIEAGGWMGSVASASCAAASW
ncbi:hypothetical protein ACFPRL_13245 [Pseudoclavibacter helvolus]